jgi:hypothetical protein
VLWLSPCVCQGSAVVVVLWLSPCLCQRADDVRTAADGHTQTTSKTSLEQADRGESSAFCVCVCVCVAVTPLAAEAEAEAEALTPPLLRLPACLSNRLPAAMLLKGALLAAAAASAHAAGLVDNPIQGAHVQYLDSKTGGLTWTAQTTFSGPHTCSFLPNTDYDEGPVGETAPATSPQVGRRVG